MSDQNTNPTPAEAVELTDLSTELQELTEQDEKNIAGGISDAGGYGNKVDAIKKAASAVVAPTSVHSTTPAKVAEASSIIKKLPAVQ